MNLIVPIVVILLALIIPYGTEKGEELTNIMSSGLFVLASGICNIISVVVWFTKKSAEDKENV
jgi:fumarate reductase subunit D